MGRSLDQEVIVLVEKIMLLDDQFEMQELNKAHLPLIADLTRRSFSIPYVLNSGLPAPGAVSETEEEIIGELGAGIRVFALYLKRGQDAGGLEPVGIIRVALHPSDAWLIRRFGLLPE